jgi:hypothetical protein
VPVILMLDECVGHMTEKVVIPEADKIRITPRRYTKKAPEEFHLYEPTVEPGQFCSKLLQNCFVRPRFGLGIGGL